MFLPLEIVYQLKNKIKLKVFRMKIKKSIKYNKHTTINSSIPLCNNRMYHNSQQGNCYFNKRTIKLPQIKGTGQHIILNEYYRRQITDSLLNLIPSRLPAIILIKRCNRSCEVKSNVYYTSFRAR